MSTSIKCLRQQTIDGLATIVLNRARREEYISLKCSQFLAAVRAHALACEIPIGGRLQHKHEVVTMLMARLSYASLMTFARSCVIRI
jgi:hypothetical protein